MTLISITDDLYEIAWRLKAINDDYRLVYNTVKNRYEVYSRSKDAIQFVVPYNELDARTVNYALMSRVQNADAIFAEVERSNQRVEKRRAAAATDAAYNLIKEQK